MNSMFSNFMNLDTTYSPNPFQRSYPATPENNSIVKNNPNKPYEILNPDKSLKGYFWYYGNSVDLNFDIEGEITFENTESYITVDQIISSLTLEATIFNFRFEPILKFSNNPLVAQNPLIISNASENSANICNVNLSLTDELSSKLTKGVYHIELVAYGLNGYNETLFEANSCTFEVR